MVKHFKKFLWVYVAYLVQMLILNDIKIFGCSPDIISVVLVIYSVSHDYLLPVALGGFAGLITDVMSGKLFGMNTLILMYFALSVSLLTDKKSGNSPVIVGWIYFVSIAVKEIVLAVLKGFLGYGVPFGQICADIFVTGIFGSICTLAFVLWTNRKTSYDKDTKEAGV